MARSAVFLAAAFVVASADNVCRGDACVDEETSLLSLRSAVAVKGTKCNNRFGVEFACGEGECCGDICMAKGGTCCQNALNADFACAEGNTCCGNACAAKSDKCCEDEDTGYKFPATTCPADAVQCTNRQGNQFICGEKSSCCGDVCVGAGGVCCVNEYGNNFPCGEGSTCCGNSCAAPGSKCCDVKGVKLPVTKDTQCPGGSATSITCTNRNGAEFYCGENSSCCGDICVGAGGQCCTNDNGNNFACGANSRCAGNICLAA